MIYIYVSEILSIFVHILKHIHKYFKKKETYLLKAHLYIEI